MTSKHRLLLWCCAITFLISCTKKPETVVLEVEAMRASSIYKPEAIYYYSVGHKNDNAELADSYLKKAKKLEDTNLQKAIFNAKRAITLYPNSGHYKYLAGLLTKAGQYGELRELYSLLVSASSIKTEKGNEEIYLFGKPDEDTYYEYMAFSFLENKMIYGFDIDAAIELGFSRDKLKERFLADKRIVLVPETEAYKNFMIQFMSEAEAKAYTSSPENFRNFLASIKQTGNEFTIDEKEIQTFDYGNPDDSENYGFYEVKDFYIYFLEERQQHPDNWYTFNLNRKMQLNDSVTVIVYAIDTSAAGCPPEMRHIYHRLATYNQKGKIIQSQIVAVQAGEQLSTLHFTGNTFTVTDSRRSWKKRYNKADFDNYVVKTEPVGKKTYVISGNGQIKEEEVQAATEMPEAAKI